MTAVSPIIVVVILGVFAGGVIVGIFIGIWIESKVFFLNYLIGGVDHFLHAYHNIFHLFEIIRYGD